MRVIENPSNPQLAAENPDDDGSVEEDKPEKANKKVTEAVCRVTTQEMEQETRERKVDPSPQKVQARVQPGFAHQPPEKASEEEGNHLDEEEQLKQVRQLRGGEEMAKEIKRQIRRKLREQLASFPSGTYLHDDKLSSEKQKTKKKKAQGLSNAETRYFTLINIKCSL